MARVWPASLHTIHALQHTFPQDYRTSEMSGAFNLTRLFIELWCRLGLAYDLRIVTDMRVQQQKAAQLEILRLQSSQKSVYKIK